MRRADSFEKTLMLGKIEGERNRGRQRLRWLDGIINSMDMSLRHHQLDGHEFEQAPAMVKDREARQARVHGVAKSWTLLSD